MSSKLPVHSPNFKKLNHDNLRAIDIAHLKQIKVNGLVANTMGKGKDRSVLSIMPNNSFYFHVVAPVIWQIRWDARKDGWRVYWQIGDNWKIHNKVYYDLNETYLAIMRLQVRRSMKAMSKEEYYYDDMDIETEYLKHSGVSAGFTQKEQEKMILDLATARGLQSKKLEKKMARLHNRKEWQKKTKTETESAKKYQLTKFINELISIEESIEAEYENTGVTRKQINIAKQRTKINRCVSCKVPKFLTRGSKRVRAKIGDIYIDRHPEAEVVLQELLANDIPT